jgi:hypothetical protein
MHSMDECQWLNCLPQAHLICQNTISPEIETKKPNNIINEHVPLSVIYTFRL